MNEDNRYDERLEVTEALSMINQERLFTRAMCAIGERYYELYEELDSTSEEAFERLWEQTARTLDRHAEVQRDQRRRSIRILQIYVAGSGAVIAGISTGYTFAPKLAVQNNVSPLLEFVGGAFALGAFLAFLLIVGLLYNVPIAVVDILSPMPIVRRPLTNRDSRSNIDGRGGIRSVSTAKSLRQALPGTTQKAGKSVLADRIMRIENNEEVIDYNSGELQRVYQRFTLILELAFVGALLFGGALVTVFNIQ